MAVDDFSTVKSWGQLDELPVVDNSDLKLTHARYEKPTGWLASGIVLRDAGRAYQDDFESAREEYDRKFLLKVGRVLKEENKETHRYRKKQFSRMSFAQKFRTTLADLISKSTHVEVAGEASNEYLERGVGVYTHVHKELHKSFEKLVLVNAMRAIRRAIAKTTQDPTYVTPRNMSRAFKRVAPAEPPLVFERPRYNSEGMPCTVHEYRELVIQKWNQTMQKNNSPYDRPYEGADGTHFQAIRVSPIVKIHVYSNHDTLEYFQWQPKDEQILSKKVCSILRRANSNTPRYRNRRWVWVDHEPVMRQDGFENIVLWVAENLPKHAHVLTQSRSRRLSLNPKNPALVETESVDLE